MDKNTNVLTLPCRKPLSFIDKYLELVMPKIIIKLVPTEWNSRLAVDQKRILIIKQTEGYFLLFNKTLYLVGFIPGILYTILQYVCLLQNTDKLWGGGSGVRSLKKITATARTSRKKTFLGGIEGVL